MKPYDIKNAPAHNTIVVTLEVILNTDDSFVLEITDCLENWVYTKQAYVDQFGSKILKFIQYVKDITTIDHEPVFPEFVGDLKYNMLKSGLIMHYSLPDGKIYNYVITLYRNDKEVIQETGVLELNSTNWYE
jgi:hypothetical protein